MKSVSPTANERRYFVHLHRKPSICSQRGIAVKALKRAVYKTPDDSDREADARRAEAMSLEPGVARQSLLREVAQIKQYAMMKRLLAPTVKTDRKQTPG